jgi:16S rRNA (cytidine1402-2'-O)-methyltransferase
MTKLNALKEETRSMVFYESPFRLLKTLEQFLELFGNTRKICVSRELTKIYEEFIRGTVSEVQENLKITKGEFVVIISAIK